MSCTYNRLKECRSEPGLNHENFITQSKQRKCEILFEDGWPNALVNLWTFGESDWLRQKRALYSTFLFAAFFFPCKQTGAISLSETPTNEELLIPRHSSSSANYTRGDEHRKKKKKTFLKPWLSLLIMILHHVVLFSMSTSPLSRLFPLLFWGAFSALLRAPPLILINFSLLSGTSCRRRVCVL